MRALTNHFSVRDLGIFPVWTLPETEINNFNDFTNSFRTTINFTLELSSKQIVFLDTEVFKGPRFIQTQFETSLADRNVSKYAFLLILPSQR